MDNPFELLLERLTAIEATLSEMKNQSPKMAIDSYQWFDLVQLQTYLPDKPAKPTVYEWVRKRLIPYHKKGKKLSFLKSEIDEWLKEGRRKTVKEIGDDASSYLVKNSKIR
ncbi:helix-turn-helix domain-containing protein [Flavihumibacter profundi]|jgi:excisionase family DNA binding protein|uniref:helix-turn-helix domain-containing protein n=1 Tax=Flavihumibacter profundi TaxID=2716883 RepID=UPI001CC43CD7|nr:helix-turn-helix domain-containing protein [Flavihumibacter profundi]MBZ5859451.1 helix-turn-helix domain-containing protein [Flavihumibacter profundi]